MIDGEYILKLSCCSPDHQWIEWAATPNARRESTTFRGHDYQSCRAQALAAGWEFVVVSGVGETKRVDVRCKACGEMDVTQ